VAPSSEVRNAGLLGDAHRMWQPYSQVAERSQQPMHLSETSKQVISAEMLENEVRGREIDFRNLIIRRSGNVLPHQLGLRVLLTRDLDECLVPIDAENGIFWHAKLL